MYWYCYVYMNDVPYVSVIYNPHKRTVDLIFSSSLGMDSQFDTHRQIDLNFESRVSGNLPFFADTP